LRGRGEMGDLERLVCGWITRVLDLALFIGIFVSAGAQINEPPWERTGGPTGAPMASVVMHPNNARILYASGKGGGVYKSVDGGDSWEFQPIPDCPPESVLHSLLINPKMPNTVYCAGVIGVLRSTDGGKTWRKVNNGIQDCHLNICVLVMDPTNPSTLYAATYSHCPETTPGAIYKSTNGGEDWQNITGNIQLPLHHEVRALAVCGQEVYAGTRDNTGELDGYLYHSSDGGRLWSRVDLKKPARTYIYSVFIDPGNPSEVWVGLHSNDNIMFSPCLFKTQDGGKTWTAVYSYPGREEVTVLGKSPFGTLYVNSWRSADGGRTWTKYFQEVQKDASGCPVNLAFHPLDKMVIYAALRFGTGIVRTTDGGATWSRCNNGITNTSVSLLAAHPLQPNVLLAAAVSGEGTFRTADGGETWTWVTGNGITHPFADELVFRASVAGEVWEVAHVGQVFVSKDDGLTWSMTINPRRSGTGFRFGSIYALATAPSDPSVIYALKNGFGIWRSQDAGTTWTFLHTSEIDYAYSIVVHPQNANIVFAGSLPKPFQKFAMIRRTTDGGDSWDTVLTVPGSTGITSIAFDTTRPTTMYAASVGSRGDIYKSVDGGSSWTKLNEHFTMLTVWGQPQLMVDPQNASTVYITTWLGGTWKSTDAGANWTLLSEAPISGSSLSIDPRDPCVIYLSDRTSPKIWRSVDAGSTWSVLADFSAEGAFLVNRVLTDGHVLYAATFKRVGNAHQGNLYRSDDFGKTWKNITGTLPRSVLDIAVDPTNPKVLYVTLHIHGAFKSIDGGDTWIELDSFPDIGAYDIEVDPVDSRILYACGLGGAVPGWCLPPTGYTFRDSPGVYKSTDGGLTWTRILETSNECRAIRIHPRNHLVLFVAAMDDGLLVSTDGGQTWKAFNTGLGTTVLTSCGLGGDKVYVGTQGCGVYSGDVDMWNWKVTWDLRRSNKPVPKVHSLQIQVDPTNPRRIFVGANPGGLFRSDDGGATFYDKNFLTPSVVVSDPHRFGYYKFALDPSDPNEVWLGTWGKGVYKSYDGMDFDVPAYGEDNLMFGKHVHDVLVDPKAPNTVYVATEEGVFRTTDAGATWTDFSAGLGTRQVRTLAMTSSGILLAGTLGYEVYQSNPRYQTSWRQLPAFDEFGVLWPIWNNRPLYQYSSVLFHPTDQSIIYFGTFPAGVYVSRDGGQTWRETNPGWPNDGVFTLVFHPQNPDIIYAGTYNALMVSKDAGSHWEVCDAGWPGEQWVFSIAFDPRDPNVMYACSKNGENEGTGRDGFHGIVMKSTDGGVTWKPITNGLNLDQEFYKILVDPAAPDVLYLATQRSGVFVSRNRGESWSPWNSGLTNLTAGTNGNNVTNTMTFSADGKWIYFGTAGSGVFKRRTIGSIAK
jgi:photosystem II stability/assembly factor-like uncharacterized protein